MEETGLKASRWEKIGQFTPLNGIASETSHVFLARDLEETGSELDPDEGILELRKVPFDQVFELVKSGEINDGQSIATLSLAEHYLK